MFIVKVRNVIVDDRINESIFDMITGVGHPGFHFFREFTELGVDDGTVSGFDVLAT